MYRERRVIKNWFSNHRATMRRTQARYRDHPFRSVSTSSYGSEDERDAHTGINLVVIIYLSSRSLFPLTILSVQVAPRTPETDIKHTIPHHINTTQHSVARSTMQQTSFIASYVPPAQSRSVMTHVTRTSSGYTPSKLSTLFYPLSSLVSSYRWTPTPLCYPQPYHTMSCSDTSRSTLLISYPESALRTSLETE